MTLNYIKKDIWFAWCPIKTDQGWVWGSYVERKNVNINLKEMDLLVYIVDYIFLKNFKNKIIK